MEDSATIVSLSIFATGGAAFWACCTHARSTVSESESTGTHGRGGVLARGRAVVYADKGAGRRSVATLVAALRDHGLTVRTILADEVVAGGWEHGCDLFAMPGGADQPYCALLNGRGNARIRAFVAGGGSFLGVCAGGYYGSASCEFELGSELQVTGARELAFFPGIARGAAFPGFVYAKETGSRAAELVLPSSERERAASPNFRDASATMNSCMVYVNGGCGFLAEDGTAADSVPGCEVLAWFADPEVAERIGQAGSPTRRGCGQVACAVRCQFGDGVAVLTGAHPELHAAALDTEGFGGNNDGLDPVVLEQLRGGEDARRAFFEKLLVELRL